ncbi:MAG: OB-fold nucleic acid binding domain-containing protein, partial [Candidatus Nanoarchaeia archaeon]
MITLPYDNIIEKIKDNAKISQEDLDQKIQQKLDQLSGLISKEGAAHIVANELGVKLFDAVQAGKLKIDKLLPGMRNVEVVGRIVSIFEIREFTNDRGAGKVGSFIIGDETGTIRMTCWHDKTELMRKLQQDEIVLITGCNARENQGRVELHLSDKSTIETNPEGESIGDVRTTRQSASRKRINDLAENDSNVEVLGTVVQSYSPTFFEVCPECGKRARPKDGQVMCEKHGAVQPNYSYVMNVFLDDGTQNIRAVFFRQQTEQILQKTHQQLLDYREFPDKFEEIKHELLGQMVKVTGRVTKNSMFGRLEFVAQDVIVNPDPD